VRVKRGPVEGGGAAVAATKIGRGRDPEATMRKRKRKREQMWLIKRYIYSSF
jgi:hypothetical protein